MRYPPRCPFDAYLALPDGGRVDLLAVRGLDGAPQYGCPTDRQMWHLFGPAGMPLPAAFTPVVTPCRPSAYFRFELIRGPDGVTRFAPAFPMPQTPQ